MSAVVVPAAVTAERPAGVRAFVRRHPLLTMYALMFALAWSIMVPEALASRGLLPVKIPMALSLAVGWAPAVAALVTTALIAGRAGVGRLLRRLFIGRVAAPWYLLALSLLALAILGGIGLHVLTGGAMPVIPAATVPAGTAVLAFVVTVALGALINTEEIAWRGFALPHLMGRYAPLAAALLIAAPEALFHLPLFFNQDIVFYREVGVAAFTLFSLALSILYAWMFVNTKGSLLLVTLMHASQNAWANLLSDNSARPFQFTVGLLVAAAVAVVVVYGPRLKRGER